MTRSIITTTDALTNMNKQAGSVKQSSLLYTASIVMTLIAFGSEREEEADAAIRKQVMGDGFVKTYSKKGTTYKEPNDKARGFIRAALACVKSHNDRVRAFMIATPSDVPAQTQAIADYLATFALSNNHYEGGAYLYALLKGLSKKAAKAEIKAKDASNQEAEDADVTTLPAKGNKADKPATPAKPVLPAAASIKGMLPVLAGLVHTPKGATPDHATSAAIVHFFSDMDLIARLIRGEKVTASKEVAKIAVDVARHLEAFKKTARKVAKQDNAAQEAQKHAA